MISQNPCKALIVSRCPGGFTTVRATSVGGKAAAEISMADSAGLAKLRRQGFLIIVQQITPDGILVDFADPECDLEPPGGRKGRVPPWLSTQN